MIQYELNLLPYQCPVPIPNLSYSTTTEIQRSFARKEWAKKFLVHILTDYGVLSIDEVFWLIGPTQYSELRNAIRHVCYEVCESPFNASEMRLKK